MSTSLITGGFKPISSYVGDKLGFQNVISNEFEFDNNNCFTGNYIPITGEKNSKFKYMERLSSEKNISFSEMVAIGDGSNDLEMLKHAGLGIGYHAHDIIKNNIENQIIFNDLTSVLGTICLLLFLFFKTQITRPKTKKFFFFDLFYLYKLKNKIL